MDRVELKNAYQSPGAVTTGVNFLACKSAMVEEWDGEKIVNIWLINATQPVVMLNG